MLTTAVNNAIKLAHAVMKRDEYGKFNHFALARKLGLTTLGNGCFSYVYSHPLAPGLAIKTCTGKGNGVGGEDETCITYLAWARANPGPHIPRVHYLSRLKGGGYVAVLDQLNELDEANRELFVDEIYNVPEGEYTDESDSTLAAAAQKIYNFFQDIAGWDLHPGNALQDINRQIVITDPITRGTSGSGDLRTGIERAFGVAEAA